MRERFGSWLFMILALVLNLVLVPARSQQLTYLPLQRPGQASVAVDAANQTAYIIDFGKDASGTEIMLDGKPLLDRLDELHVERLVVSCSHPHSDHMGGIRALFQNANLFFKDTAKTQPRFKSVRFIDDGVAQPLHSIFRTVLKDNPAIDVTYASARSKNAFEPVSASTDAVFVENIPYRRDMAAGVHGAAVVTKITLEGKYTILDFDDAESGAIERVVAVLQKRGVQKIDAFVVPHHGSRYHDIEPIFALNPKSAIITVNPENRYGHPAPEILLKLLDKLRPENVVFTGSMGGVVLDGSGIKSAQYTAADPVSYELFVAQSRVRAKKLGRGEDELALYAAIESRMRGDRPPDTPPAPARVLLNPHPPSGSGGATRASAADSIASDLVNNGTMHTSKFDVGRIRNGGASTHELAASSRLPGISVGSRNRRRIAAVRNPAADSAGETSAILAKLTAGYLPGQEPLSDQPVKVDYQYVEGVADGLVAARTLEPAEAAGVVTAMRERMLPKGGMVFLDGGKLFPVGPAGQLSGGTLDVCGAQYCITPAGDGAVSYILPFAPSSLFAEVWDKVVRKKIQAFYLSINPTKRFLKASSEGLLSIPSDKLHFGTGNVPLEFNYNEVVTAGDINHSPIGDILWKADVAFKSASLGMNVFTGARFAAVPVSLARLDRSDLTEYETDAKDRWCRLYWTSGSQRVLVDPTAHKVRFDGEAVVARSEPMILRNGRLEEYPSGTWCSAPKVVAQRLQRAANDGTGSTDLLQLRKVAQMQNFAKWAFENDLKPSAAFQKSIDGQKELVTSSVVPTWTSGIRAKNTVYVEAEKRWSSNPWSLGLHVSTGDVATLLCVTKYYMIRRARDFEAAGLKKKNGTWVYHESDKPFFAKWIDRVAGDIATCANGMVVVSALDPESADEPMASDGGIAPPTFHIQPVHVHGGVLLGSDKEARKARWLKEGRITLPDGRLILRRDGNELHFWAFDETHPTLTSTGQHATVSNGKLADIEAFEGRMRVLVETTPGTIVREEARIGAIPNHFGGAEWMQVRDGDGALIAKKAAWFCDDARHDSVCVADLDLGGFGKIIAAGQLKPGILVEPLKPNLWLIDIDAEDIRKTLDDQRDVTPETDTAGRFALIGQYADWGFQKDADDLQSKLLASFDSEDFILTREYNPGSLNELGAKLSLGLLDVVSLPGMTPAEFLNTLQIVEKVAAALPPRYSAPVWQRLADGAEARSEELVRGVHAAKFNKMRDRYIAQALRTNALKNGAHNPWAMNEEQSAAPSETSGSSSLPGARAVAPARPIFP
jgi:beta-lactamase superfamily II metal-dependent hydrolase